MVTEIRQFDTGTIVLYTDNRQLANRIIGWKECFKVINYEQDQKHKTALIGLIYIYPKG